MIIRKATLDDYDAVWEIFSNVIKTGDTYVFNPSTPKKDLEKHWFAPYMHTYVAVENNVILGTYILKPNQIDLGSHIANAGYMVNPSAQGRGVGRQLCAHSIDLAAQLKFRAIQFNIVVSTNKGAVGLWQKFGFDIIGTTPDGFLHSQLGFVDTYIMYKRLYWTLDKE